MFWFENMGFRFLLITLVASRKELGQAQLGTYLFGSEAVAGKIRDVVDRNWRSEMVQQMSTER